MYQSPSEQWAEERERVAAKTKKAEDRKLALKAVEELPTLSQRVIGRVLLAFVK